MKLTDESLMPNGAHKGKKMEDVPAKHLMWIYDNKVCRDDVREYIEENLDVLNHQIQQENNE